MPTLTQRRARSTPGRPAAKSGLPAPRPGEPFSLIATLRRTRSTLTVDDVATLLVCSRWSVYDKIAKGLIPVADLGFGITRIDPGAWLDLLEHKNPHLCSARKLRAA